MYHSVLQTPILPPTITDQIRLWELEKDRLQFTEGECVCAYESSSVVPKQIYITQFMFFFQISTLHLIIFLH